MDGELIARARGGDSNAFEDLVAPHRRELQVHCYRMLGSLQDAEDAVQETLLSAWQGLSAFEGRSSVRTWLYRVATNRCLDMLRATHRRPPTVNTLPRGVEPPEPTRRSEVFWLQPFPDVLVEATPDAAPGPEAQLEAREATTLAFVTALQMLPPLQRAVLILRDVLGYRAREVATMLATSEESVTSALKRARASVETSGHRTRPDSPAPESPEEAELVERFVEAFTAHDVDGLVALLTEDAWIRMPPMPFEYQGREAAAAFFAALAPPADRRLRLIHTRANGQPAVATYALDRTTGVWRSVGVLVLTVSQGRFSDVIHFEPGVLASFGLPRTLPAELDGH